MLFHRFPVSIFILMLSLFVGLISCQSSPMARDWEEPFRWIVVGRENCDYRTIQEAVDSLGEDTNLTGILLMDSVHYENGISIDKDVLITGKTNGFQISGTPGINGNLKKDRLFKIEEGGVLYIVGLTLTGGELLPGPEAESLQRCGGGLANWGRLYMDNCTVKDNRAAYGGGLWNAGYAEISGSSIEGNRTLPLSSEEILDATGCNGTGGGIKNEPGGELILTNTVIRENASRTRGGGLYLSCESQTRIDDCLIFRNSAVREGGGLNSRGDLLMSNTRIIRNSSSTGTGGFFNLGRVELRGTVISRNDGGNYKQGSGGFGIYGKGFLIDRGNNKIE